MDWRNKTAQLNSNIMLLIITKRNQSTRNQPKLQTLLKANDEIRTKQTKQMKRKPPLAQGPSATDWVELLT